MTVRVLVIDALWYVAAGSEVVRHVVVRDFPGHERDDVFVSTDPALSARAIIESFAKRWSLPNCYSCGGSDPVFKTLLPSTTSKAARRGAAV